MKPGVQKTLVTVMQDGPLAWMRKKRANTPYSAFEFLAWVVGLLYVAHLLLRKA